MEKIKDKKNIKYLITAGTLLDAAGPLGKSCLTHDFICDTSSL